MAMNEQRKSRQWAGRAMSSAPPPAERSPKRFRLRYFVLALAVAACGGSLGQRKAGGESHFLEVCEESCGGGLQCISGVCTRSCLVETADCSDLSPRAMCTN